MEGQYMYKLLEIKQYVMTRDLIFLNEDTNSIELCFDYLFWDSYEVEIGKYYDCKILLFGELRTDKNQKITKGTDEVACKIIGKERLSEINCYKVEVNKDIYYVAESDLKEFKNEFNYLFTRKDLIYIHECDEEK